MFRHIEKYAWTKGLQAFGINDPAFGEELAEMFPAQRRKSPFVYDETFQVLDELKGKIPAAIINKRLT
ncbi:hypothetical protein GCM10020331_063400 [Ectobacillus funiculus]